jgi:Lrp/AsnC family transcriptional regulator, leucine-responsive regulatory protein
MSQSDRAVDETDRHLLQQLAADGRLSHAELARRVNLSRPAVHHRLRRLEAAGVIRGYRADLDWPAIGFPLTVFVLIRVIGPTAHATADEILRLQDPRAFVDECYRVAGDWSLLVRARASTTQAMEKLLDRIRALPNVHWSHTAVTLSAHHEKAARAEAKPQLS